MGTLRRVVQHGWFLSAVGAAVLLGALVALWFPVLLDAYDQWGMQTSCGTGYRGQLSQATAGDLEAGRPPGAAGSYVDQCRSALWHRRAWAVPLAGVGAGIVIAELVAWARHMTANLAPPGGQRWAERPDTALHEAARLDRRFRPHGPPPNNTTL